MRKENWLPSQYEHRAELRGSVKARSRQQECSARQIPTWVTKDVQPSLLFLSLPPLVTQGCLDYVPTKPRCVCALRGPLDSIQSRDATEHLLDNHGLLQSKPASYSIWDPGSYVKMRAGLARGPVGKGCQSRQPEFNP